MYDLYRFEMAARDRAFEIERETRRAMLLRQVAKPERGEGWMEGLRTRTGLALIDLGRRLAPRTSAAGCAGQCSC